MTTTIKTTRRKKWHADNAEWEWLGESHKCAGPDMPVWIYAHYESQMMNSMHNISRIVKEKERRNSLRRIRP